MKLSQTSHPMPMPCHSLLCPVRDKPAGTPRLDQSAFVMCAIQQCHAMDRIPIRMSWLMSAGSANSCVSADEPDAQHAILVVHIAHLSPGLRPAVKPADARLVSNTRSMPCKPSRLMSPFSKEEEIHYVHIRTRPVTRAKIFTLTSQYWLYRARHSLPFPSLS